MPESRQIRVETNQEQVKGAKNDLKDHDHLPEETRKRIVRKDRNKIHEFFKGLLKLDA
jgi:hypothetical protein